MRHSKRRRNQLAAQGTATEHPVSWSSYALEVDPFNQTPLANLSKQTKQGSEVHNAQTTGMASTVDLSTLAHVSEGYTAGSIYRSVKTTLTPRRVHRIAKRPLLSSEFLGVLAQQQQLLKKNVQARFHISVE